MIMKDISRNWRSPTHPKEKFLEKSPHITDKTGKLGKDERVSDGIIIPKKRGNSCGGKYPYY
jgi:hypothetical protein